MLYSVSVWLIPLIIAIVFHEVAHGLVANMLGDTTAAERGRLSFNPIRHVDPVGTLAVPLMLALTGAPLFGWAKPVPVDFRRLRNPRLDMVLVALAGPMSNLFLATLAAIALRFTGFTLGAPLEEQGFVIGNLVNFLVINVSLAVFNLLPIPPFDGSHVVEGALPRPLAARYAEIGRYGFLILFMLIVVLPQLSPRLDVLRQIVWPIVDAVLRLFLGSVGLGG